MVKTQICSKCLIEKELTEFYQRNTKFGYRKDCKECTNKVKTRLAKERIVKDKCKRCNSARLKGSRVCLFHCIKNICIHSSIDTSKIEALISKLYAQNFECYYTGKLLLPGDNLSIDHIVPTSKGGTDDLSNLVWVDITINRIKNRTDLKDFLLDSYNIIEEIKFVASLESLEQKQAKLNYVLGVN